SSTPTTLNDPLSGLLGYPVVTPDATTTPATNRVSLDANGKVVSAGDVNTPTSGLGQSYFLALPALSILGTANPSGERRIDLNYPGYNFNISDQRRALEFNRDFDRMLAAGTLPQFLYIYQPNDHTGSAQAPNAATVGSTAAQQVADGDVGLGMVVQHIMKSPVYYDPTTGTGSAIFITYDDAQSTLDHIHQHRTPVVVVSPFAKPGFLATRHYSTASIVKTEELLMGLPPNNLGDLFATDMRDFFQSTPNNITATSLPFTRLASYHPSPEGKHIWSLVKALDTSAPDRDSHRLGVLARLSMRADAVHAAALKGHQLNTHNYRLEQARLYGAAVRLVKTSAPRDTDG
ncbi:MAG: hypothetical protein M3Y56_04460, partial [Armatimonadota bacterium]|nr:hypothetical protein [Armatimonadota bacterium]